MKFLRALATFFVILLVAGFALAFSVYNSYTELAEYHRKAKSSFADWEAAMAPRREMLNELAELTAVYSPDADEILREAERIRAEAPDGDDISTRARMHELAGMKLTQLRALAMRYPQLRDSDSFRDWETAYLRHSIAEEAARTSFNSAARRYNDVLDSFTGKLISFAFAVEPKPVLSAPAE